MWNVLTFLKSPLLSFIQDTALEARLMAFERKSCFSTLKLKTLPKKKDRWMEGWFPDEERVLLLQRSLVWF